MQTTGKFIKFKNLTLKTGLFYSVYINILIF